MSGQVFKNEFSLDKGECVYYLLSLMSFIADVFTVFVF